LNKVNNDQLDLIEENKGINGENLFESSSGIFEESSHERGE
jgi:hypothetical protein